MKNKMAPQVSIVIVNWNVKNESRNCLESIHKNISGIAYEIIIVDNNSSDGSIEMVKKEYPDAILITNEQNLGYGRANNQGIRVAKGEFVLILNPDTIVLPGTVEKMLRFMEKNPDVGACGPLILEKDYKPSHPVIYDPSVWELFGNDTFLRKLFPKLCSPLYGQPDRITKVHRLSGCFFLARLEALKKVGLFDERIFLFYEDTDLFCRLRRNGWCMYYLPEISVIHLHSKSVSHFSLFQKEVFVRQGSLIYFRNRYGFIPSLFFKGFLISSYLLYLVTLEMLSLLSMKRIHKEKISFYRELLKLTCKSLFGLG